jgi:hypothetical protein
MRRLHKNQGLSTSDQPPTSRSEPILIVDNEVSDNKKLCESSIYIWLACQK